MIQKTVFPNLHDSWPPLIVLNIPVYYQILSLALGSSVLSTPKVQAACWVWLWPLEGQGTWGSEEGSTSRRSSTGTVGCVHACVCTVQETEPRATGMLAKRQLFRERVLIGCPGWPRTQTDGITGMRAPFLAAGGSS